MIDRKFFTVAIEENEFWWGGAVSDGLEMPYGAHTRNFKRNLDPNETSNQCVPFLVSSKGRYIWCDRGFELSIDGGLINVGYTKERPILSRGGDTLKEAYLAASTKLFPPSGILPPQEFFSLPIFNTWIEFEYFQEQSKILEYARAIRESGLDCGIFMIDCGWHRYNGNWQFKTECFPDPKAMIDALHSLGFKVMLWVCPFITADSLEFRSLEERGLLVRNAHGEPAIRKWWDGYSAVLDLTNPLASEWLKDSLNNLVSSYGVDGFKFDAGDSLFYDDSDLVFDKQADANAQCEAWIKFGLSYQYNEFRSCFKNGGQPLIQRLCDKRQEWGEYGVKALVPSSLAQGIMGYPFSCADMVGGGSYQNVNGSNQELYIRYMQNAAFMPAMQFSIAPWRTVKKENWYMVKKCLDTRKQLAEYILEMSRHAAKTNEPVVRYMEYEFPGQGLARVNTQFMLGDKFLIAPANAPGQTSVDVILPKGRWLHEGKVYQGDLTVKVEAPLDNVPVFERM